MSNPVTDALKELVMDFEFGMALGPDQESGTLAPTGEIYHTFINGRVLDEGKITDLILIARLRREMLHYKKHCPGRLIYWRERPDFHMDFVNAPTKTLKCRVVISEKELVK